MDSPAEARNYDAMDHGEVNRRFVDDLLTALDQTEIGVPAKSLAASRRESGGLLKILDLGTGTAQIPILLCRLTPSVHVTAIDAAVHMLELARQNIAAAHLSDRIVLSQCDAKRLPFSDGLFDCVMSNSIVHHLPDPSICLRQAVRVACPGGLLFFRDLLHPADENQLAVLVNLYAPPAGKSPAADHGRAMFSDSLRAALTLEEVHLLVGQLGFSSASAQATSDRHWTWTATKSA
jgi:ubiquinone/menaquinone biosynthesis C-methylase UbiE